MHLSASARRCGVAHPALCPPRSHSRTAPSAARSTGVVIVDHGSRKAASNDMLVEFAALYQRTTGTQVVEAAHMEIAEPTIEQAIGWLCAHACMQGPLVGKHHSALSLECSEQCSHTHPTGKCIAQGVDTVVIAPYFLSKGRHIQEDIPLLVKEAKAKYPGIHCIIADPIGQ